MHSDSTTLFADWKNRHLVADFLVRRVHSRFRGSVLGIGWMILLPLLMLSVYTLVFDHFLGVRWPGSASKSGLDTALRIYIGLIVLNFFAENITSAPSMVLEQPQLVKKIVFPVPVLAYVLALASALPLMIGILVSGLLALFSPEANVARIILAPLYLLPLLVWALAINWWLGALGVYVRDIGHLAGPVVTLLMFMSPIFYGRAQTPEPWQTILLLNPLTIPIESVRALFFEDQLPSLLPTLSSMVIASLVAIAGRLVFSKLQVGFSDVM